mgnify:CR=1 FL=1
MQKLAFGLVAFANLPLFLIFFIPAISMRLWAEDRRSGTFELLMTLPLRAADVMLGKYFAALAFYAIGRWLETFAYHTDISPVLYAAALLITMLVTVLTVTLQAYRAAVADPVKALRHE